MAPGRHVVAFEHLEVALLLGGVMDEFGADLGVLDREARGRPGDPPGSLHHLLAQVSKQAEVVIRSRPGGLRSG